MDKEYNTTMSELLSPAGTQEAFYAAISNGANAIYLGLDRFSARAYANNFTLETLKPLLNFAHLRNVKIYVTINTIVYDDELNDVFSTIDELAKIGIDGVIVQDLAVANYITSHFNSLHAHASTQMGVDDFDAASLLKNLGFTRIVFARETPLSTIKDIKEKLGIEVETFIHGALCVSYSGNCYMSSAIGERSGNRGRCAGCCRKFYTLLNTDTGSKEKDGYLLSMKDLNVSQQIGEMSFIDSLKIEGRMKEPYYVASVTNVYRKLLDNEKIDFESLDKVFNRTYTQGFMNGENAKNITNIEKPNNYGYLIGNVIKQNKQTIWIRLNKPLNKGDQIRIETTNTQDEISIPVLKMFDANFNEIFSSEKIAVISCKHDLQIGARVYKTKDIKFVEEAEFSLLKKEYQKIPISVDFVAHINKPVLVKISYQNLKIFVKSDLLIEEALTQSTTKDNVVKQLSKLNDTPYSIEHLNIDMDSNCFIPLKLINELRREAVDKLDRQRLSTVLTTNNAPSKIEPQKHFEREPEITIEVSNEEQYLIAQKNGIKHIYYKNIIRRNNVSYPNIEGEVLVNGYGGIKHYIETNTVVADSSLNVVNHISAAILSSLGVERITLSQEISKEKIQNLLTSYFNEYNTYPNLELIVYGRSKIMHSKYCPLKRLDMCGKCKKNHYSLKDEYASFPIVFNDDCTTTLLNSKPLNIMDDLDNLHEINYYRMVFTTESANEVETLIKDFQEKLSKRTNKRLFKNDLHTRGHFFKNPL